MSKKSKTPTFICEVPLIVSPKEDKILAVRFEMARHHYNQCLAEAKRRFNLMRQSKKHQQNLKVPRSEKTLRNKTYQELREEFQFEEYSLHSFEKEIRNAYFKRHIDSHVGQSLATRAYSAVNRIATGKAKRVRFKGKYQLSSLEGKCNTSPLKWKNNAILWKGLFLKARIDKRDSYLLNSLKKEVKYARVLRRRIKGKWRFSAQLVLKGTPPEKEKKAGQIQLYGVVGLDLGPSSVAIVGQGLAELKAFCPELKTPLKTKKNLQRKLDRQRRASNPQNYNPNSSIKKGKKSWLHSKGYIKTKEKLAQIERKLAAQRKTSHGRVLNFILLLGTLFCFEKLSYKGWQKGLFGKSILRNAPGQFIQRLKHKAESASAQIIEINTSKTKLSQTCHCGTVKKKKLAERAHQCECGVSAQRDLYSAYLAKFVDEENKLHANQAFKDWSSADSLLQTAWEKAYQTASVSQVRNSFGNPYLQRQSGSSEEERLEKNKARNVVVSDSHSDGESPRQLFLFPS